MQSTIRRALKFFSLIKVQKYRYGLKLGVAAAIEHKNVIGSLKIGTLVDVGANVGQFSLLTKHIHPSAKIFAFEPLSEAYSKYCLLFRDDKSVKCIKIAAGEFDEYLDMNVSGRADSSSLLDISKMQDELFPGTAKVSIENVKVSTLDGNLPLADMPRPIVIKLDVQGFELCALKGGLGILSESEHVYAEVSFLELYKGQVLAHELIAWLSERGFDLAGIYNVTHGADGLCVQADALFSKSLRGK